MGIRFIVAFVAGLIAWLPQNANSQAVEIREWLVPWENSRPRDPYVDRSGRVWFVGQKDHYVANLRPETGEFNRYDLHPGTGPHNLIVADDGYRRTIWYAGNLQAHIGKLNLDTGRVDKIEMPEKKARDPHTLTFDSAGDIWFTVQRGNFIGFLAVGTGEVTLLQVQTKRARPYGIAISSEDEPWVAAFGSNKLIHVDRRSMTLEEFELPNEKSRPRRLAITSDDNVWYVDYALGLLGRFEPAEKRFTEWVMPSGDKSYPYGMAVDKNDRLWFVEMGMSPNRFVGFDTVAGKFLGGTEIPSGAGAVRHMYYFQPAGEIWFGTDTNYVGRAKVH